MCSPISSEYHIYLHFLYCHIIYAFLEVILKNCFDPSCLAIDVQLINLLVVIAFCALFIQNS